MLKEIIMNDKKVEEALNKIRPQLMMDGGNVELVEVNDGTVKVKLPVPVVAAPWPP